MGAVTTSRMLTVGSDVERASTRLGHALRRLGIEPPCAANPERWFGEREERREAATICRASCPVLDECAALADAIDPEHGVWAGHDRTKENR